MKPEPKPNLSIISKRNFHSTLSKAFSASNDTNISGVLELGMFRMFRSLLVL